jgi:hypothetical protein
MLPFSNNSNFSVCKAGETSGSKGKLMSHYLPSERAGALDLSLLYNTQTDYEALPTFCAIDIKGASDKDEATGT